MSTRCWALMLAMLATATALSLSVLAGWQRGGTIPERLIWIALGTVLVTSAHLLPALIRDAPVLVRGTGGLLWGACLVAACYGHAVFFTFAQQHAAQMRASAVRTVPAPSSVRSLASVMAERASVTAQLAAVNARVCVGHCVTLEGRRARLSAKLDALDAQADDIRRGHMTEDRVTAQRDALLADPVTTPLAGVLGTNPTRVDLVTGLAFAAVLEGVACLLWTAALRVPTSKAVPGATGSAAPEVMDVAHETPLEVTSSHDSPNDSHAPHDASVTPLPAARPIDEHLSQLMRDVTNGSVRPTVADIRRHLGCSQARAATLRRQLAQLAERNVST